MISGEERREGRAGQDCKHVQHLCSCTFSCYCVGQVWISELGLHPLVDTHGCSCCLNTTLSCALLLFG